MRRIAVFTLLVAWSVAYSMPAQAQQTGVTENERQAQKLAKRQQKMFTKAAKNQQKAIKKYEKAQQRAQKKAVKEANLPVKRTS